MTIYEFKNGLYLTVIEEDTGFYISIINDKNEEVDGYVNPFSTLKDAENACEIISCSHY